MTSGAAISRRIDPGSERGLMPTRYDPELEATIYRVVQEALVNAVKHAGGAAPPVPPLAVALMFALA